MRTAISVSAPIVASASTTIVIGFSLLLSACSVTPTVPLNNMEQAAQAKSWNQHQAELAKLNHWQLSGRFGAKTDIENWTGSIHWQQNNAQYNVVIAGPLSSGSIRLDVNDNIATLQTSTTEFHESSDAQSLLYEHTGLILPVNELQYWLLGLAAPNGANHKVELDKNGLLSKLTQANWEITFKRYTQVNNTQLPNKIYVSNRDINVRLVIQKWQVNL